MLNVLRYILFTAVMLASLPAHALINRQLEPETLHYKIMYKWGLINKQAGHATLTLSRDAKGYVSQLTAASEKWADGIYCVRDTLNGHMGLRGFTPLFYEKIAHEGSEDKHDVVRYDYSVPGKTQANTTRREVHKGEVKVNDTHFMETDGPALDMLTSFYYMRTMPFESMAVGDTRKIAIFSGKQKELLTIKYRGIETIDVEGTPRKVYHITFIFTSKGGKKSSEDMDAWISADSARIPYLLEGKLPIGKVRCFTTGH